MRVEARQAPKGWNHTTVVSTARVAIGATSGWRFGLTAEECAQEAVAVALRRHPDGPITTTYLCIVVRGLIYSHVRQQARYEARHPIFSYDRPLNPAAPKGDTFASATGDPRADPSETFCLGVLAEKALALAREHADFPLLAAAAEGRSTREIAQAHGLTEMAVKQRLWRLRRSLRARLGLGAGPVAA